jgi:hypothetical protein
MITHAPYSGAKKTALCEIMSFLFFSAPTFRISPGSQRFEREFFLLRAWRRPFLFFYRAVKATLGGFYGTQLVT